MSIGKILYRSFIFTNLILGVCILIYTLIKTNLLLDFSVFYGSARNALGGVSIYTHYGPYQLPYWYFPWVSWIFIPLAVFPLSIAWGICLVFGLAVIILTINTLANYYQGFNFFDRTYMFSMVIWMSWQVYHVGQISYLILGVAVLVILLIAKGRSSISGLLMPLLLIKPHLFIIFIPLILWMGGKKTLFTGTIITLLLLGIETMITPHWAEQMVSLLVEGTRRVEANPFWDFSTLPTLLGFSQNYSGTANLAFTIVMAAIAAYVVVRFRSLPKIPLLSMAMVASLFCAPRTYAYDLVLLIPAMIWLSEKWSIQTALLWATAAIIPILAHFSAGSYILTLLVFILCIYKAYKLEKKNSNAVLLMTKPA